MQRGKKEDKVYKEEGRVSCRLVAEVSSISKKESEKKRKLENV